MISGAGLCWQHVGGMGSTTTTECNMQHFNCPDIPTTLTVWDLWTDPVGVAALLDVWGEKLGGPRAGV